MNLLSELERIHQRMQDPFKWNIYGICVEMARGFHEDFRELARHWPLFSGDTAYPVPDGKVDYHTQHPHLNKPDHMWDRKRSSYAERRWQLLEWAIEELKK